MENGHFTTERGGATIADSLSETFGGIPVGIEVNWVDGGGGEEQFPEE
jgi:hypothetical protein